MTRSELKSMAKEQIKGNILLYLVCALIIMVISAALNFIPLVGWIAVILVSPPLSLGLIKLIIGMTHGEKIQIPALFDGFQQYGPSVILYILTMVFTFLWSILLVIPGIIKAFSYSMGFFILAEHPEMSGKEALDASKDLMNGHKMDLFVLILSFIPWMLLGCITIGLAYIYVAPYMSATIANFYNDIKGEGTQSIESQPVM